MKIKRWSSAVVILLIAAVLSPNVSSSAQQARRSNRNIQLALSRICVSESGFQLETRDCEFIYHVLRRRSQTNQITMRIMRSYSPRSFDRNRTDRRRWISHLNRTFREPRGWSETSTVPWSAYRQGYIQVYEFVGRMIETHPSNPCNTHLDHWGAPGFRRRQLLRRGWTLVDCGSTLNDFWSLPSRNSRGTRT